MTDKKIVFKLFWDDVYIVSNEVDYETMVLINDIVLRYQYSKNAPQQEEKKEEENKEEEKPAVEPTVDEK
jgi:hypothetical protein